MKTILTGLRGKLKKVMLITGLVILIFTIIALYSTQFLATFGSNPSGERLERIKQSPNYNGKKFVNSIPTNMGLEAGNLWNMLKRWLLGKEKRVPKMKIPVEILTSRFFEQKSVSGLRATWMGHSSVLIELDGIRVLTDPVWGKRCSFSTILGPARFHPPPISLEDLPKLDAVIISHDHYDHLEKDSVTFLAKTGVHFYMPLGVGANFDKWGIPADQVTEMDWWESVTLSEDKFTIHATPGRHFSGRIPLSTNSTLWASFVITGPEHRFFFSGDTGMFDGFEEIGRRLGPFDLTMIKIGAYDAAWPDIHVNPEQVIQAHKMLKGDVLLPIHWGTFNLAFHAWNEPIERLINAGEPDAVKIAAPRPGQLFEPSDLPVFEEWWK